MTYSLSLEKKDLRTIGSQLGIVFGLEKLSQDLDSWLREGFQTDRFHPNYGSVLDSYIGTLIDDSSQFHIEQEVFRVLQNYQSVQMVRLKENPSRFSYDEILGDITSVTSVIQYDAIIVTISYTTYTGTSQVLTTVVTG